MKLESIIQEKTRYKWLQELCQQYLPQIVPLKHNSKDTKEAQILSEWMFEQLRKRGLEEPKQQKDRVNDIRNMIKAIEPNHIALESMRLSTQEYQAINNYYSEGLEARGRNAQLLDNPSLVVAKATELLGSPDWAEIAVHYYCPLWVTPLVYKATIQGHYQLLEALAKGEQKFITSFASDRHYDDYEIGDGHGNVDGRKGIKLHQPEVVILETFQKQEEEDSPQPTQGGDYNWIAKRMLKSSSYTVVLTGLIALTGLKASQILKSASFQATDKEYLINYITGLKKPGEEPEELITLIPATTVSKTIKRLRTMTGAKYTLALAPNQIDHHTQSFINQNIRQHFRGLIEPLTQRLILEDLIQEYQRRLQATTTKKPTLTSPTQETHSQPEKLTTSAKGSLQDLKPKNLGLPCSLVKKIEKALEISDLSFGELLTSALEKECKKRIDKATKEYHWSSMTMEQLKRYKHPSALAERVKRAVDHLIAYNEQCQSSGEGDQRFFINGTIVQQLIGGRFNQINDYLDQDERVARHNFEHRLKATDNRGRSKNVQSIVGIITP